MPTTLNILPVRVPIGRVTDANGRSFDVLMTPEFARALSDLMARVGGANNFSTDELAALVSTDQNDTAALATLQRKVLDQAAQLATAADVTARLAALEKKFAGLEMLANSAGPAPVDWEHPGKIGAGTANSGKFTTLEATGAAKVLTLNKITFTQPATAATFTLADGKTFSVNSTMTLTGTDGATLNIGGGGTLGSAAYADSATFAAKSMTALGPAATDAASTQALTNNIRSVLQSVGIGT